jgi:3-oxoacyl-[acyl-carrier protein] reductase
MNDRYAQLIRNPVGRFVASNVGLPQPVELERYEPGQPVVAGTVLLGGAPGGRLARPIASVLAGARAAVATELRDDLREAAKESLLDAGVWNPEAAAEDERFKALVFDASGIASSSELRELWAFFHPTIRRLESCGRVLVLGTPPEACDSPAQATAQRALEGFTRSVAKEARRGSTAQLLYVAPDGEDELAATLRFFLSPRSAYVSGQVVRIAAPVAEHEGIDWDRPLAGRVAIVTGAARGIGEAIARTLARDGAHVVGVDVPAAMGDLDSVVGSIGGSSLALDITEPDAPKRIADHLGGEHEGVDAFVHNAGVTRDKTLGRMPEETWTQLLEINLGAPERINAELLERDLLRPNGRIVGVSSISGIAGNAGQTNYATSKAGVIGMVQSMAPGLAERQWTINAVAPGFIDTRMTEAMPFATREAGRRMNSMAQGGQPIDVAETIAWLVGPGSSGVNGNVVRVCGQSLIGA